MLQQKKVVAHIHELACYSWANCHLQQQKNVMLRSKIVTHVFRGECHMIKVQVSFAQKKKICIGHLPRSLWRVDEANDAD